MKYLVSFVSFALVAAPAAAQDLAIPVGSTWFVNGKPVSDFGWFVMWPGGAVNRYPGGMIGGHGLDTVPGILPGNPWGLAPASPAAALGSPRIDPQPWYGPPAIAEPLTRWNGPSAFDTSLSWRW